MRMICHQYIRQTATPLRRLLQKTQIEQIIFIIKKDRLLIVSTLKHMYRHAQLIKSRFSWHQEFNNVKGCLTLSPLKRLKPLSAVTHSQFHSITSEAIDYKRSDSPHPLYVPLYQNINIH